MGQQVSKDIRSRLEHCTLEELLTNDKYTEELQRHLPGLPKRSYNNLAKILTSWENTLSKDSNSGSQPNPLPKGGNSSPKDRNSLTSKLGPLWSIKSKDITISESVAEALKRDHCNLLRQGAENGVDLKSPEDLYEYTCNIETRRGLDRILWRFLTTSYHDIILELDGTKQRCSPIEDGGIAFVVAVICQSRKHDPDKVRKRVMDWVKVGRRYRGFMNALSSGCLILFPEKTSDLVWEQYVPIKGDAFAKVIQFLQDLGIVDKCEEGGWNDLSDKILQTLREPFRTLIPFQFQPGQQSQIEWVANSSLALVAGDADIHRPERSILGHERVEEIQDMDIDNPPSGRTLDPRALPRLAANGLVKTKWPDAVRVRRKRGPPSVKRQLQSFARNLPPHPEKNLPWVVHQSRQVSINNRTRDPLSDILNESNVHPRGTDSAQHMQDGDSSPSSHPRFISPPEPTGIGSIRALLNRDNNTLAVVPTLLKAIQIEKTTLYQIVLERPNDILGGIWFGSLPGYSPFVSLRLPRALNVIVRPSSQEVYIPEPSPGASSTVMGTYLIKLGVFRQMIQRDGFGEIFWNDCGEEAFVTMLVLDEGLAADFIRHAQT